MFMNDKLYFLTRKVLCYKHEQLIMYLVHMYFKEYKHAYYDNVPESWNFKYET